LTPPVLKEGLGEFDEGKFQGEAGGKNFYRKTVRNQMEML
jgi:hypothetical protein